MAGKITILSICLSIGLLAGCAPVFSVEIYTTPTAVEPVLDVTPVTETPEQVAGPVATTTVPAPVADVSPILYAPLDGNSLLLLGGLKRNGEWLEPADALPYLAGGIPMDFYTAQAGQQVNVSVAEFSPQCAHHFVQADVPLQSGGIGVIRGWSVSAREIREISSDNPVYARAAMDWLNAQGWTLSDVNVTRIVQVDLEGDGVNEVLLSATYFKDESGHMAEWGDYSMVLLRKVVQNEVVTIPVVEDYYVPAVPELSFPHTYTLGEFIDLNNDGILEVIVDIRKWEGGGAAVFQLSGPTLVEVLRVSC